MPENALFRHARAALLPRDAMQRPGAERRAGVADRGDAV
jgi:hypothetical protein